MSGIKKEDGPERTFSTGASKQAAAGKGTPVLFPPDAYLEISKHFEEGAILHGDRNWEKGVPLSEWMNSIERHAQQVKMGLTDEAHMLAMAWNAVVYVATKLRIDAGILPKELDDIPVIYPTEGVKRPATITATEAMRQAGVAGQSESDGTTLTQKMQQLVKDGVIEPFELDGKSVKRPKLVDSVLRIYSKCKLPFIRGK